MVEYFPIPVFPEIYAVYLVLGTLTAIMVGMIGYHLWFHREFYGKVIKRVDFLGRVYEKIMERVNFLQKDFESVKAEFRRRGGRDNLFNFILLKYLASEPSFSSKDKLLFASMISGARPSKEIADILVKKSGEGRERELSDEQVAKLTEELKNEMRVKIKERIKQKVKKRLGLRR